MPIALPALDLAAFLIFCVILVLALTVQKWLRAVFEVVDKVIGWAPFVGHWIKSGENHVLSALNVIVVGSRAAMSTLLDGVRWSLREFEVGVRDFADLVQDHWHQLVVVALPSALAALYASAHALYSSLDKRLDTVEGRIADIGPSIRKAADAAQAAAIATAAGYADKVVDALRTWTIDHVHGVYKELEGDITSAISTAEQYTDQAVGDLRRAEDAAIAAAAAAASASLDTAKAALAVQLAAVSDALTAARAAIEGELTADVASLAGQISAAEQEAETAASSALQAEAHTLEAAVADAATAATTALQAARATLESELGAAAKAAADELHAAAATLAAGTAAVAADARTIAALLAAAETAAAGELTDIYNLPADALRDLLDRLDLTKVASFGAGLVLLRGLVNALTREAGLDSAECRAKSRQICGTPGDEWSNLLAGAAFLTGALSLAELVPIGRAAVHELAGVIRQAA